MHELFNSQALELQEDSVGAGRCSFGLHANSIGFFIFFFLYRRSKEMIEICSLRTDSVQFAYDVRVDRANPILGNRFRMTSESDRDRVCDMYERWFNEQLAEQNEVFLNELRRLYVIHRTYGKLRLFCWCAPKRCHAETIRNFLNKYI